MAKWQILREGPVNTFTPTGEVYDDAAENAVPVGDHVAALQDEHGVCFAAERIDGDA